MTRKEKVQIIEDLTTKLKEAPNFYIADTGGMSVAEVNRLRRMCYEAGVEMRVIKNTLIRKTLDGLEGDYESMYDSLKLHSAVFFPGENLNAPAKVIKNFREKKEIPRLKVAYVEESVFLGDQSLAALIELKSKEELIGEIIGLLQSPAKTVISALKSSGGKLAGILKTLSEREG